MGLIARLGWLAWLATLPPLAGFMVLLWFPSAFDATTLSTQTRLTLTLIVVLGSGGLLLVVRERLVRPLQTAANILSGLREGDYSFRARSDGGKDAFRELLAEVNTLVDTMRQQRLGALEATALLRTVTAEIDVAVFAFDGVECLRLVNRAGERLLAQPRERLLGRYAADLGVEDCLEGETPRTLQRTFPGGTGRWGLQRRQFRQGGLPHTLVVLSDLSRELREEEKLAWQRLVRVMGHELNNSLAPVKSIAGSLDNLVQRDPLPADWREDMREGLGVIASRAESLNRFVGAYAQLARLPKPRRLPVAVPALLSRAASMETRVPVQLAPGPACTVLADPDQLEQALINLIRNGADAVLESGAGTSPPDPGVTVGWARSGQILEITIQDCGGGLASTANLFVPFFTTKPRGSGIGLVLCRQIAEAHGGSLMLENRAQTRGCVARFRLPCPLDPS